MLCIYVGFNFCGFRCNYLVFCLCVYPKTKRGSVVGSSQGYGAFQAHLCLTVVNDVEADICGDMGYLWITVE